MAEITYKGLYNVPSDYECADGQLATSLNLVPENGSLQPIFPPSLIFTLPEGYKVAYIHKTTTFTHYIITRVDDKVNYTEEGESESHPAIYWLDSDNVPESKEVSLDDLTKFSAIDGTEIVTIQAVGNTLIIITGTAMNYYLWKTDEDNNSYYQYLGTHLPELDLSFGLQGCIEREVDEDYNHTATSAGGETVRYYYGFEIKLAESIEESELYEELSADNKSIVTERVLAQVNKFIADHSTNSGKFLFPFFVRYAYRLYDESLTMHSAPIFMPTCSKCAPTVFVNRVYGDNNKIDTLCCTVAAVAHSLDYEIWSADILKTVQEDWKDIIKSVDIFVSAPLYNYDQNGEVIKLIKQPTEIQITEESEGYTICRPFISKEQQWDEWREEVNVGTYIYVPKLAYRWENFQDSDEFCSLNRYCRIPIASLFAFSFYTPAATIELPCKTEDAIKEDIRSCCNFYFLKSIKIEDMETTRTKLEVAEDYLQSLVNRELMTDDYDSHDTLVPSFAYNYNNRLDIANITKTLYKGYNPYSLFCYGDGYVGFQGLPFSDNTAEVFAMLYSESMGEFYRPCEIYVYIKQDSKTIIVKSEKGVALPAGPNDYIGGKYLFLYYPNTNAYKAVIYSDSTYGGMYEVNLENHDFLNGAFYFEGWSNPPSIMPITIKETSDQTVSVANKLYLSEINNPFFFPVEQIVTVGTGKILGIATAAKPLSQGQFGSFPLYAFCDDGVWALSVNNEGIYSAVQPITRDVCINEKAITQLDSSVLFPTNRGIMQISGNAATCITDVLNGDNAYDITQLPHYEQLLRLADITDEIVIKPIREFLKTGVMLYDYTNQRIYVCSDDCNFAYVISCKSQEWGMAVIDISSVVNSYPDAYAMTSSGDFVNFTEPDKDGAQNTLLISRPIKLDGVNTLKTATSMLQRGYFDKRHIQCALWGSRDLMHWHTIRTSQSHEMRAFAGTPYKYFRIAVLAQLTYGESIFGATLQATPRLTNKAR